MKSKEVNFESYLIKDIENGLYNKLSELEFTFLRIHKYFQIFLKEQIETNQKYVLSGNTVLGIKLPCIEFYTSIYFDRMINYNGMKYNIEPKARCITFNYKGNSDIRFVINKDYLEVILKKYEITSFYVSTDRKSNFSIEDAFSIFDDSNIIEIIDNSKKKILSEENFNEKFNNNLEKIKDISFNSSIYFKDNSNDTFIQNIYSIYFKKINNFLYSNKKIIYLVGPRKSGKSIFLNFLRHFINYRKEQSGSLYLNIEAISRKLEIKEIKSLLYYEFLYLIVKREEIEDLHNLKLLKGIKYDSPMIFLKEFINNFINKFDINKFSTKEILIIIDNVKIYDNNYEILSLKEIFQSIELQNKFKFIFCGEGIFFISKIRDYFAYNLSNNEDLILMNNNELFLKNKNIIDNISFDEEIDYLNNFKIHNLIYCKNLNGITLNILQFMDLNFIKLIPNYLQLDMAKDFSKIKFYINNDIFIKALNKKISFNIKNSELNLVMKRKYFPRNVYGISEELLIILLLKYNKFKITSLIFEEKNLIEIEEISKLKDNYLLLDKFNEKKKNSNYLITQKFYNGKNYNVLIIQSLKEGIKAIFVEIGIDKNSIKIQKQLEDLKLNSKKYLKNLENYFDFDINYISLLYIFDEDTQKVKKNQNITSGSKYCIDNKIDFLLYSFNDKALKKFETNTGDYNSINGNFYTPDKVIFENNN